MNCRGTQGLESSTQDHIWSYKKGVLGNEAFLLDPNENFRITCCSTTAKLYIWWLVGGTLLMESGLLRDFFGNFSTQGERYYFCVEEACKVDVR